MWRENTCLGEYRPCLIFQSALTLTHISSLFVCWSKFVELPSLSPQAARAEVKSVTGPEALGPDLRQMRLRLELSNKQTTNNKQHPQNNSIIAFQNLE